MVSMIANNVKMKQKEREEHKRLMDEYEANGGQIKKLDSGLPSGVCFVPVFNRTQRALLSDSGIEHVNQWRIS